MHQRHEISADAASLGRHHPEYGIGGDCGVDGVSAQGDGRHGSFGGEPVGSGDSSPVPGKGMSPRTVQLSAGVRGYDG